MSRLAVLHRCFLCFLFAALLVLAVSCTPEGPQARQGVLDLSAWDFETGGLARLDGEWELWWNEKVPFGEGDRVRSFELSRLPGYWNTAGKNANRAEGAATYHLDLKLPPGGQRWALVIPDVACAWELAADGAVVGTSGTASTDPLVYRARVRPQMVSLPQGSDTFQLALYVVNRSDRVGGVRDSILVGPADLVAKGQRLTLLDSGFFIGGLLVMAVFNIVIFFLQRQKIGNLWLSLFAVFIAVRTLFTGPRLIYDLWPTLTFELSSQIEFLCIFGAVVSIIYYLKALFPDWWPARILIPFLFYTCLFTILLFVLPLKTYADAFLRFYDVPLACVVFVFLGVSWWAMRKKHEDGALVFFGMVFLVVGALNDVLYQFVPLPQGYLMGRFLFIFLIFNTYILSRQLSKDFNLTQKQSTELRQLDRMKDDFLARVTHELRTPIHGMVGILDAFKMGDFGPLPERQTYHLGLLESSSKRLLSMVNSILDFSHLKKHQLVSDSRPILLKQTVDFLLPSFYPQLKPGVALVNRVSDQLPAALGDEVKFEQVLHHLLLNALQHIDSGTVSVEAELKDQQILVLIRDTGHGIPKEKLAQLFSPFQQVAEIDTRSTGGLGLGLAISRQLVQLMGGRLEIQSVEGTGTTAQIWIPVCPPAKLQYFQSQRLDRVYHWEHSRLDASPVILEAVPSSPGETSGAPTILIVDDEPVNLLVLRTFLTKTGYAILEASSGPEALEKVTHNVVDLMILDIMMPGMSGYEVCTKVRERFSPARLPILLLTAKNQVEDLLKGYQCGASDFVTKPFQREELKARMDLHLQVSRSARTGTTVVEKPDPDR